MLVAVMSVALLALLGRVVQLQALPSNALAPLMGSQQSRFAEYPQRGPLIDLRGRRLASNRVVTRLFADPSLIESPRIFAQIVGDALGYDPRQVEESILARKDRRYVLLDDDLTDAQIDELSRLRVHGLGTQHWVARDYPQGPLAGQVLGFAGREGKGLEGVERSFDRDLAGRPGELAVIRSVKHQTIAIEPDAYRPPEHGQAIRLTIDTVIQTIAEDELAKACRQYGARHGELVVMDPNTGYILAMANYPAFDPGEPRGGKPDAWRNRCVTDQFEPGSIFKPFVWAMAVEQGKVRPSDRFDTTDGGLIVLSSGRRLRDTHGHGRISAEEGLVLSSNILMALIAERMGDSMLYQSVHRFGFGQVPGSELPGEAAGTLYPVRKWSKYTKSSIPMGQEIAVTPLQMMTAFSAIASDGTMPQPMIRPDAPPTQGPRRVISPDTAATVRRVLRRAVTEGTGRKANSDQYAIFGKTGTAQVPERGRYQPDQYVGSFVGGAPLDDPQIVVGCFIHRPDKRKGYYGGIVAAPAAKQVVERTLTYLGVPPARTTEAQPNPRLIDLRD